MQPATCAQHDPQPCIVLCNVQALRASVPTDAYLTTHIRGTACVKSMGQGVSATQTAALWCRLHHGVMQPWLLGSKVLKLGNSVAGVTVLNVLCALATARV